MPSARSLLLAVAAFSFAAAAPSNERRLDLCGQYSGLQQYECFGFVGCCDHDPCTTGDIPEGTTPEGCICAGSKPPSSPPESSTPPPSTNTPVVLPPPVSVGPAPSSSPPSESCIATITTAVPAPSETPWPKEPVCPGKNRMYLPEMFVVKPDDATYAKHHNVTLVNGGQAFFMSQSEGGKNQRLIVLNFRGLPPNAKSCELIWQQPLRTNFAVFGTGALEMFNLNLQGQELAKLAGGQDKVTWALVKNLKGERAGSNDLANWPGNPAQEMKLGDGVSKVQCNGKSEIALLAEFAELYEGSVIVQNNDENPMGFHLRYEC